MPVIDTSDRLLELYGTSLLEDCPKVMADSLRNVMTEDFVIMDTIVKEPLLIPVCNVVLVLRLADSINALVVANDVPVLAAESDTSAVVNLPLSPTELCTRL